MLTLVDSLLHKDEHSHDAVAVVRLNGSIEQCSLLSHGLEPLQTAWLHYRNKTMSWHHHYIIKVLMLPRVPTSPRSSRLIVSWIRGAFHRAAFKSYIQVNYNNLVFFFTTITTDCHRVVQFCTQPNYNLLFLHNIQNYLYPYIILHSLHVQLWEWSACIHIHVRSLLRILV